MNNGLLHRRDGESLPEWTLRFLREAQKPEGLSRYAFACLPMWEGGPIRSFQQAGRSDGND
jgi:hypothetical protein